MTTVVILNLNEQNNADGAAITIPCPKIDKYPHLSQA